MSAKDIPLMECAAKAEQAIRKGATIYQKWTCAKCGERVMGNNPNALHTEGLHEECGHVTDLTKQGCGFMAHFVLGGKPNGL